MKWRDYVADREKRDPEFRAARVETRPQFEFRRALLEARVDAGLTQRQMAARLGVKQPALARWETGETMPTLATLYRVAQALRREFSVTPEDPFVVTHHRPGGDTGRRATGCSGSTPAPQSSTGSHRLPEQRERLAPNDTEDSHAHRATGR